MNRNNTWRWIFVVLVFAWSLYEIYPPTGRDLTLVFRERAVNRDAAFSNIVARLQVLQEEKPGRPYGNLIEAADTNNIAKYFPFFDAKNELNPTRYILNRLQRESAGRIKLGLDLQGGTSFLVEMDTNRLASVETVTNQLGKVETRTNQVDAAALTSALDHAVEVLRRRVDKTGVAEPVIQPAGNNRILIQLPGLSDEDRESAKKQIQKAAFLEFRMVHEKSDEMIRDGLIEPGYEILKEERKMPDGTKRISSYLVKKKPEHGMTGQYIKSAGVSRDPINNAPEIDFSLTTEGTEIFAELTRENTGRFMAIVLDGELYSAPRIKEPIENGRGRIDGQFDIKEAFELANILENPLKAPLAIISSDDVDPSLGKDSIQSGLRAAEYGVIAVAGFMLVYYMFAGLVANVALLFNIIILLGVMCSIGTTLTLPGIAGVVLTIGMAVDANVLIFERIREELAVGKSMRGGLAAGYNKAFSTIFDSNLTTLISSVILIFMGTGPVKGFGVTLTIGVTVSMFTALVVTRLIFDWLLARDLLKNIRMLHIVKGAKFDFMKWAVPAFVGSWLLILIGNGYGVWRGSGVMGVDFAGGDSQTFSFAQRVEVDKLREAISKIKVGDKLVGDATIQYQKDVLNNTERLRITTKFDTSESVMQELKQAFPEAKFKREALAKVGPIVGQEIQKTAVLASLLAMFGILIYVAFRYEFSFAVGAVVAILHDILMTLGWFFLTGRELSAPMVAAILTIIGFSINDTIVIFDRIREDLKLGVRGTFKEVMNQALNQTLSRTLITSGTVFLATLSLYIFGGGVINDFAFTFLVGILTGTYSSIYIASAIVLWWHKGERPKMGGSQVVMQPGTTARN